MVDNKLSVLFAAAEIAPIAKVGGLADVVGALPIALNEGGVDVTVALPYYSFLRGHKDVINLKKLKVFPITYAGQREVVEPWSATIKSTKVKILLFDGPQLKSDAVYASLTMRDGLYINPAADLERFVFFNLAVAGYVLNLKDRPHILHCHDWHAGLLPFLMKSMNLPIKTVYTIHNLANQGVIDVLLQKLLTTQLTDLKIDGKEYNLMATGIRYADAVTTVSETYAKEILTKEFACNLQDSLQQRSKQLSGILNGIDTTVYDPVTNKNIYKKFDVEHLADKLKNKTLLQKELKLPADNSLPLVGLVSRFVNQKGFDLISEKLAELPARFVFLGSGQKEIEVGLRLLESKYKDKFRVILGFDEVLAQKIYAGSDFFLMPSKFEPCGLGQMIAMRFGAVPIVRLTGGLADTVNEKNGFGFFNYSEDELLRALNNALTVFYTQPKKYLKLQRYGFMTDFSWLNSAKKYINLYIKVANIK